MYSIILMILLVITYVGLRFVKKKWKDSIFMDVAYSAIWLVYSVIVNVTAFRVPNLWYSSYVVFSIASIIIILLVANYDNVFEGKKFDLYIANILIKQGLYECVACGVLFPQLMKWHVQWMSDFLTFSILHINGNIAVVIAFEMAVWCLEVKHEFRSPAWIIAQCFICMFHAMIVYVTGSILLPVLLRMFYIFLFKVFIDKRLKADQ